MKVHGILYKSPCVVVTGLEDEVDPQLEDVLLIDNEVYFNVKLFEICHFSEQFHCYVVALTSRFITIFITLTSPTTSLHSMQGPSPDLLVFLRRQ